MRVSRLVASDTVPLRVIFSCENDGIRESSQTKKAATRLFDDLGNPWTMIFMRVWFTDGSQRALPGDLICAKII